MLSDFLEDLRELRAAWSKVRARRGRSDPGRRGRRPDSEREGTATASLVRREMAPIRQGDVRRIEVDPGSLYRPAGPLPWEASQRPDMGWESEAPPEALLIPRSVWGWLLRRSWVVVLAAIIGAVLQLGLVLSSPPLWEAESVVVVTESTIPISDVGSVAKTAFQSATVIQPVIDRLDLDATPRSLLSKDVVEAQVVSGTGALRIIARWPDPDVARDLSRGLAFKFVALAESKKLGTFAVFEAAGSPGREARRAGPVGVLGAGAGAAAGLGALLLLFMARQPVTTAQEGGAEIGADATFAVRVRAPGRLPLRWTRREPVIEPIGLAPALSRRVQGGPGTPLLFCLLADRRPGPHRAVRLLAHHLTSADGMRKLGEDQVRVVYSDDSRVASSVLYAQTVVLVAAKDASRRAWLRVREELRVAGEDKSRILVFVT